MNAMDKKINIDPIDEVLRMIYLNTSSKMDNAEASDHLQEILNAEFPASINEAAKETILERLYARAALLSFGELLDKAMEEAKVTAKDLADQLEIAEDFLLEIKQDRIYTNNVPIMFIKSILDRLRIPFQKAEEAILYTYELIKNSRSLDKEAFYGTQPSFRKGSHAFREASEWPNRMQGNMELFENEEALRRYLGRLSELMNME